MNLYPLLVLALSEKIIISLITLAGVIITSIMGIVGILIQRSKRIKAEDELNDEKDQLSLAAYARNWDSVIRELEALCADTEIDRFIILQAWNGTVDPRFTSAVFQFRRGKHEIPTSYQRVELDTDYVERLMKAKNSGRMETIVTDELEDCLIKSIYQAEGVVASAWAHIETRKRSDGRAQITYCSFASHDGEGLTEVTITKCYLLVGKLRAMAELFHQEEDNKRKEEK